MRSPVQNALCTLVFLGLCARFAPAQGLRITTSKRSDSTPVQDLNRRGVKQIQRHNLRKAERIFYKAYLIDPDDPFTLNNLGYISELEGKIDRAQRYYQLAASENNSETEIELSSASEMEGRKLSEVTSSYGNLELRVNRGNILAMTLLEQGRSPEAEDTLRETLKLDSRNPFTLNNLGFAMESEGDLNRALDYYNQAAMTHSKEPIVVALDPRWRGRPISDIAFENEQAVRQRLRAERSNQDRAARLEIQGVAALNHNDPDRAFNDFREAYRLDPAGAFSMNDMGYVSEAFGDEETAKEFYSAAQRGNGAGTAVHLASRQEMVGEPAGDVAASNSQGSESVLAAQ
ncbi:MAG: tetratricopeptide repeat protein, partial [Acidobacteria bacterium]|nr:tetratricopeptide repeat protein [Acidobacteriota bacterium]